MKRMAQTILVAASVVFLPCMNGCEPSDAGGTADGQDITPRRHVFTTSTVYDRDLRAAAGSDDGISGADWICAQAAAGANLQGTWVAWISDVGHDAIDRIQDLGPWYLMNETRAFNNKANLATTPLVPIDITEHGLPVPVNDCVWTNTAVGGRKIAECVWEQTQLGSGDPVPCGGAHQCGFARKTDNTWTSWTSSGSMTRCRLYCFQQ